MTIPTSKSFSVPLHATEITARLATVVAPDSLIVRLGGRTSDLPFVGTLGTTSFALRRPGRNSFKPAFVGRLNESPGSTIVEVEARNIFDARNPAVLFASLLGLGTMSFSAALASGAGAALAVALIGAAVLVALFVAIAVWQEAEIESVFAAIERQLSAANSDGPAA